jgi:hypothetical protein
MRRGSARLAVVATIAATMVTTPMSFAGASGGPQRESFSFTGTGGAKAGKLCDFRYRNEVRIEGFTLAFVDGDGEVTHDMTHAVAWVTHVNADTGATLTERLVENSKADFVDGMGQTVGMQWNLRDAAGKIVLVVSGRLTYTLDPFEILSVTPQVERHLDFPNVICPALGGAAA